MTVDSLAGDAPVYDPYDPAVRAEPYGVYAELRSRAPVARSPLGFWAVTRYRDVAELLRDPRLGQGTPDVSSVGEESFPTKPLIFLDPPDHTRLRALVTRAFSARTVERLRPSIVDLATRLLERAGDEFDLVAEVGAPLPVEVICDLVGVPESDRRELNDHVHELSRAVDPSPPPDAIEELLRSVLWFAEYFTALAAERRRAPGDDLFSALVAVEERGERLTLDELVHTATLLFSAGHETTVNLLGNGFLALLTHPTEERRLRTEPELVPSAIEEMLRWDGPVQFATPRIANERLEVAGATIEPGDEVRLLLGSANRDPDVFDEPDRFDVGRAPNKHVAFGGGGHFCLGASLARLEARVVVTEVLERFSSLELAGPPTRRDDTAILRGLTSLPVRGVRR